MDADPSSSKHLAVLVFTDVVGSVALQVKLGTEIYARLIARHHRLFEDTMRQSSGGDILQNVGDGFLAKFQTASDAVNAALRFQYLLSVEPWDPVALNVRIGLDQGEIMDVAGVKNDLMVVGMAANTAARVMDLAMGGQILMTRAVFDDARQYVKDHPRIEGMDGTAFPLLQWPAHGRYLFKGVDDPAEVYEVGGVEIGPLKAPPDSEKAKRSVSAEEEATLGWRPGAGLEIPRRSNWIIEAGLGRGAFGEVWLATHRSTRQQRVFKFCFDSGRLRSFKREITLFRLLREGLGKRDDIAAIYEVQMEMPPFYLESEYHPAGNMKQWAEATGGMDAIPRSLRIDIVIRVAYAVGAAHSVGIIHKDIKPSNILINISEDDAPRPRLADFGIGTLADDATLAGLTLASLPSKESSSIGTPVYMAPEYLVGDPPSFSGDIYALGVLLYQVVVGDLTRPLGPGWERDVDDPLLREDISSCVDIDPSRRFARAGDLAGRLESLEERREEVRQHELEQERLAAAEQRAREAESTTASERARSARQRQMFLLISLFGLIFTLMVAGFSLNTQRVNAELEKKRREERARTNELRWIHDVSEFREAASLVARGKPAEAQRILLDQKTNRDVWARRFVLQKTPAILTRPAAHGPSQQRYVLDAQRAFSPDGRILALANGDSIEILDPWTGDLIRRLPHQPEGVTTPFLVECLTFTPGPDRKLVSSAMSADEDGRRVSLTRIWDVATWKRLGEIREADPVRRIYFNDAMTRSVTFFSDAGDGFPAGRSGIRVDKVRREAEGGLGFEKLVEIPYRNLYFLLSLALTPEGDFIAVPHKARDDGGETVSVWDLVAGEAVFTLPEGDERSTVSCLEFSPDSSLLLVAMTGRDPALWDWRNGRKAVTLSGPPALVLGAAFHPEFEDTRRVLTYTKDGTVHLWETGGRDGARVTGEYRDAAGPVRQGGFTPDGKHIFAGWEAGVFRLWEDGLDTGILKTRISGDLDFHQPIFSPGSEMVCINLAAEALGLVGIPPEQAETWARSVVLETPDRRSSMYGHDFSGDGRLMAIGFKRGQIGIWDARSFHLVTVFKAHEEAIGACVFTPDSRYLLTGARSGKNKLWDTRTWQPVWEEEEPEIESGVRYNMARAFFSREGLLVKVYTSHPGKRAAGRPPGIRVFRMNGPGPDMTLEPLLEVPGQRTQVELNASLSPDGTLLATAFHERDDETDPPSSLVHIWDVVEGRLRFSLGGHSYPIEQYDFSDISFSSDSTRVVAAANLSRDGGESSFGALLWQLDGADPSGEPLPLTGEHSACVIKVKINREGTRVVTASKDGTVCVWDATTGRMIRRLSANGSNVLTVAFSPDPDASLVATLSDDRMCRLWNVRSGKVILTTRVKSTKDRNLLFSPDGRHLWVTGWNDKMEFLQVPSPKHIPLLEMVHTAMQERKMNRLSPDGSLATSLDARTDAILVQSTVDGKAVAEIPAHDGESWVDIRLSRDNRTFITLSVSGDANLWDIESRQRILTLPTGDCLLAVFASDGSGILTVSRNTAEFDRREYAGADDDAAAGLSPTPIFGSLVARFWPLADEASRAAESEEDRFRSWLHAEVPGEGSSEAVPLGSRIERSLTASPVDVPRPEKKKEGKSSD